MEIRKTRISELDKVMEIYAYARRFMAEHNNPNQWGNNKPAREQVEADINNGKSYVCVEDGEIAAVFYYACEADPTYINIYEGKWINDKEYGVVHRIASSGKIKGAGSFCVNWAFEQSENLRIDTHRDNVVMQNMLQKNGFEYCGIIYIADGSERMAFQRVQ
ncbi:MAG: GNAT family N-acetyltransferase [Lachnospiraceae bacterium]|nr:GNAT family N-acetyltransferase [Lachnospiraceae bacterium]